MSEINVSQREELHRAIWAIADELRGSIDGWDFKKLYPWHNVLPLSLREIYNTHRRKRT